MTDKQILDWLQENAPLAIWRGTIYGKPVCHILRTDLDASTLDDCDAWGTGTDIRSAVINANEPEEAA